VGICSCQHAYSVCVCVIDSKWQRIEWKLYTKIKRRRKIKCFTKIEIDRVKEKDFEWGFLNAYKQSVHYKIRKIKIERQNETYTPKESEEKKFGVW
jgi:hypothetical protein